MKRKNINEFASQAIDAEGAKSVTGGHKNHFGWWGGWGWGWGAWGGWGGWGRGWWC